jgi:predicted RNase H-like nuclease
LSPLSICIDGDWLMASFLRRNLALDDAIDAAVLALSARRIVQHGSAQSLPNPVPVDGLGRPMAMLLPPF